MEETFEIWGSGCPCGDYIDENIEIDCSCRKSNSSKNVSGDLVQFKILGNSKLAYLKLAEIIKEIGEDRDITVIHLNNGQTRI